MYPPPPELSGVLNVVPGSGRWVLGLVGRGLYSVRAEYRRHDGTTVVARQGNEMTGLPSSLAVSLRFTINLVSASRYDWVAV